MITVMGATGNVGGEAARRLLGAGIEVRALSRSGDRLSELATAGAEVVVGDPADVGYLTEAFAGADGVFTMLPYDPFTPGFEAGQRGMGEAIVTAIRATGVSHVVALSSLGAELESGTGFVASLHGQELRLRALEGVNVLALRPGLYFEDFETALPTIEEHGINADAIAPDVPVPMVATADVGAAAARALRSRDWEGFAVREVVGTELTFAEATRIVGGAIGRPGLEYVQLSDAEMEATLAASGFAPDVARLHVEMARALSDRRVRAHEGRVVADAISLEEFAERLVPAGQPV